MLHFQYGSAKESGLMRMPSLHQLTQAGSELQERRHLQYLSIGMHCQPENT